MVTNLDLEKWQIAILGIEKEQNNLSAEELSAFNLLKELLNKSDFENSESGVYIQTLKTTLRSHDQHRLLQAHLTNFITLCEQYFAAKTPTTFAPPQDKKTSNLKTILVLVAIALLVGAYFVWQNWDFVSEKLGINKEEVFVPQDTISVDSLQIITSIEVQPHEQAVPEKNEQNVSETKKQQKKEIDAVPEKKPETPSVSQEKNTSTAPTIAQLNTLLNKIGSSDAARDEMRNTLGNSLPVVGAANISNVQQLITDVSNGAHYQVSGVNTDAAGKVVSITVNK